MDFDKLAPLTPLLSGAALTKPDFYKTVFSFSNISGPTFNNLLFEWRALGLVTFQPKGKVFSISQSEFLSQLKNTIVPLDWEYTFKRIRPTWFDKYGAALKKQVVEKCL